MTRRRGGSAREKLPYAASPSRRRLLLVVWLAGGMALLARSVQVQIVEGAHWNAQAEGQQRMNTEVAAGRGAILDRSGVALVVSHETFRVAVAPHELENRAEAASLLAPALGIPLGDALRITSDARPWVQLPGRYPPAVREALARLRGVYVERDIQRSNLHGSLARGLLGTVVDHAGLGGVEEEFEELLRGTPGAEVVARDSEGRPVPGETSVIRPPRAGGSVVLSLDVGLQEIAREALDRALRENAATGGDLLVTDPRTGEILAMVSLRDGSSDYLGAISTPYEPGSTLKPFTVAALLREGRATLGDSVRTEDGRWLVHGRQITDVSRVGTVTLARALQLSSNVGIAKAASALTPDEQFEGLRDFGFGVETGVPLSGEAEGTLRRPSEWSLQSPASLAIGYEIAVTPIQLVMAYGALANGGVLMEPRLVKEIRDEEGRVLEKIEPRAVRRVVSEHVADEIKRTLVGAVELGTGTRARLSSFTVAGKSGTSRAYGKDGYGTGEYFASFVGFFPAEDPQLVIYVKLERPSAEAYYGGQTAAPVTRATLEAILAARNPPLDRGALAVVAREQREASPVTDCCRPGMSGRPAFASTLSAHDPEGAASSPVGEGALAESAGIDSTAESSSGPAGSDSRIVVPDVRGLSPRAAARRLHFMGLGVEWDGSAPLTGTAPEAGAFVSPGATVRLLPTTRLTRPPLPRSVQGEERRGDRDG